MFMSISLGFSKDFKIASLVISWNTARFKGTYNTGGKVEGRGGRRGGEEGCEGGRLVGGGEG